MQAANRVSGCCSCPRHPRRVRRPLPPQSELERAAQRHRPVRVPVGPGCGTALRPAHPGRRPGGDRVGRLGPGKGHTYALDAWPTVLRRVPDARLLLVGDGAYEADLRTQADRLGLSGAGSSSLGGVRRSACRRGAAARRLHPRLPADPLGGVADGPDRSRRVRGAGGRLRGERCARGRRGRRHRPVEVPYTEPRPLADAIMPLLTDPAKRAAMGAPLVASPSSGSTPGSGPSGCMRSTPRRSTPAPAAGRLPVDGCAGDGTA